MSECRRLYLEGVIEGRGCSKRYEEILLNFMVKMIDQKGGEDLPQRLKWDP